MSLARTSSTTGIYGCALFVFAGIVAVAVFFAALSVTPL